MRPIDADALKELFSEVIGHIAKKPEMNGNLEHMIRASAMVIQMIDDAPTVQPDTTTHDSIPAKTGENDGDKTSGDCVSRQEAKDIFTELYGISAIGSVFDKYEWADICETTANELPSVQSDIIRCPDCYYNDGTAYCELHFRNVKAKDFCSWAERRENGYYQQTAGDRCAP